jgi:competence protein ComEC
MRATHPGLFLDPAFAGTSDIYAGALRESQRDHVGWRAARAGDSLVVDGVVVSLLAPDSAWMAGAASPNDASVIARVRYGDVRFLLTGDAEAPEEAWLVNQWGADALRADVLKVGHHGSSTSSSAMLRDAVRPRIALVSVGSRNRYGHPNPGVMAAFAHDGVQVLRTDRLGTVVVQTDGRALRVRAGGEEWEVARTENPRGP